MNLKRDGRCKFVADMLLCAFLLVTFVPAVSCALSVSVSENSQSIGRYHIYELTMSHSDTYSNPWEDVLITAVFTSPSSSTYTVGGFYYDTDTWKLRFAPVEEGSWTWILTFDNGSETFVDAGGFNCVSSDKSGFLRVHPQNPYRFVTDADNKSFYPMGFNDVIYDQAGPKGFGGSSDGTLNSDWWMDAEYVGWPIDYYFDTFADAGNNMFRMNTQTNTYLLYDKLNISGTGKNSYLVPEGKLTDQLAQKLHEGGWKFYMVFWQKPNLGWDLSDANVRQATLSYHKYIIDRWGAYVDIWELMNERSSQDDRYFDYVATFIRDWDPYDHIISTSNARPDLACIEINSPHRYNGNDTRDIHRLLAGSINNMKAAYFKPVLYGEFGNSYPPYTNYDPERYRIFIWTAMFNEAALVFWHTGYAKNYQSGAGNMFIGPEERAFLRIFSYFTIDFDALAMPIPVALSPSVEIYASALGSGQDISIYFTHSTSHTTTLSGATVTLDIPDDGMQGLWLDPSTGNMLQTFTVNSSSQTLTIPDFHVDIALRIRGAGSNWAPVADAGADQGVIDSDDNGSEDLILDGSGSCDPDGTITSYLWSEDGSQIAMGVKPAVSLAVGTHTIRLVVTDDKGATGTSDVEITVNPVDTPTITVLTPGGGESYTVGQTITVTWTSTNFTGNVRIVSNHGGYRWDSWMDSTENDGSWTSSALPTAITKYPSTGWKFRVAAADDREPSDESGSFSIRQAGTSITLTALADSWIQDEGGNSRDENMGTSSLMAIGGRWHNTYFRGMTKFDLSPIPYKATVSNARLQLYHTMNAVEGRNVNNISVYGLLRDWKEYEVTWNSYAAAASWTTPGAGSIGNDRENTILAQRSFTSTTPVYQYYDFDVTSDIQDYVNGAKPNYGFVLIGKEAPAANRYFTGFSTKESASNPPLLSVTYTTRPAAEDTTPPSTPTNLQATVVSSSQIDLSWTASTDNVGVTGYKIYRDGTEAGASLTNVYSDAGLQPAMTYTYTVSAYDAAGNESGQSIQTNATMPSARSSNVDIDGSIEYQTIQGLGGQMESHDEYVNNSQFWDLLFDDLGVSAIHECVHQNHTNWDQEELFPVLKEAKNHGVQHFFTAFLCPPEEWKGSGDYLLPEYYDDWASEILNYINYVKTNTGVDITDIAAFDEPTIGDQPPYARCRITASEYINFLKVAGPVIRSSSPNVKVHIPVNWNIDLSISYANTILSDPTARDYVDILSTHTYGWHTGKSNPQKWQTFADIVQNYSKESYCSEVWHGGSNNPSPHPAGILTAKWIHHTFVDGHAVGFIWWNMLEMGRYRNARGFVHSKDWPPAKYGSGNEFSSDGITKWGYAFKQFARWVRPGAIRVGATSTDPHVLVSSYRHPTQNTFTLVAINDDTQERTVTFNINNLNPISSLNAYRTSTTENTESLGQILVTENSFTYTLPRESITTFTGP
ncbi:MAG: DNRLRE domain-containing protein [Desulfobacteraceae bacterium]|nr:DNRLRE domain-containing protein [Desulfobacteraceae bacterium]